MSLLLSIVVALMVVWPIASVTYNLFFHPLRSVPGPFQPRASFFSFVYYWASRHLPHRNSTSNMDPWSESRPKHLSFCDSRAWKDIGQNCRDGQENAFSSHTSLRQQEPIMAKSVNLLMQKLHDLYDPDGGRKVLNAVAYNFGCLEDSTYHPWITGIRQRRQVQFHDALAPTYRPSPMAKMNSLPGDMIQGRLGIKEERADLFDELRKILGPWNLSSESLPGNAFILVLAGSETTSTTLSGATYLLTKHLDTLAKLASEVRSAFNSADEIGMTLAGQLPYLRGVLNESLQVPRGGSQIPGQYVPGGMRLILARIIYDFGLTLAPDSQQWIERLNAYVPWDRIPLNVYFSPLQS
ncbi:cytochrome P450 [Lasiosphaeris hirsuta]|uniref:Cytochrome P450 n=1 Tax=Lasiosphaeris hirsuta TaxID=260670 RepID=A0AA40AQP1_9PEZI|nr:cytochrome P450 [Lasiosphaeris hirsuta]